MRHMTRFSLMMLVIFCLALAGCSGSGSGDVPRDVFNNGADNGSGGPIFGIVGDTGITLTASPATVDANNGQVMITARVVKNGARIQGLPISFSIVAPVNGPAAIESGMTTVTTDTNGEAITRITTGNATSTTNVIVSASATVGTQSVKANTTFQIIRGTGIITIDALPVKSATVDPSIQTSQVFQQQIPIKLTDANGFARVGVAVTLSSYKQTSSTSVLISQPTINTDASGLAIFNATVTMTAPASGITAIDSVIYTATTSDATPIVAYAAGYYSITSTTPSITDATMILTTDSTKYDINDGSVLATAKIVRNGAPVSGVSVTFSITEPTNGPATIETGLTTVTTDSNGLAVTRIRTGNVASTTNVIMRATATIGGNPLNATATFQIVPPPTVEPIIILSTDRATYDVTSGTVLATAKVIKNGVAISGAPVTFSITAPTNGPATIESGMTTVNTDSNGIAVTRIKPGTVSTPTNVIVSAAANVSTQIITATTTFLIVPDLTQPSIVLTTDRAAYDVNSGTVLATARIVKNGLAVAGVPVTFSITAPVNGPATIESGLTTVMTDSNGMAVTRITAGTVATPTNVIVSAAATVIAQPISATTTFLIMPDLLQPTISLTKDRSTIDGNNGQVLVTARVVKNGAPLSGVPVTFKIEAPLNGPATIESGRITVNTDSNGEAITRITTGDTSSTTNVIVSASAAIGSQAFKATTTFQIVRGTGIITIGDLPVKSTTVDPSVQTTQVFQQQIPIKLTDSNGFARVGTPVSLSVYSQTSSASIQFSQPTIVTDASGLAIFNATVTMAAPLSGLTAVDSVIYKAVTADAAPVIAYVAGYYSVTSSASNMTDPTMILTTDSTVYDINDGSVLATAKIVRNGVPVSGVPVTFSIIAPTYGPATIESGRTTVTTDSNGLAVTRIMTGNVTSTANVIMMAAAAVGTKAINATATFQIVPPPTIEPIIILTTDRSTYDVTSGTVLATAKIVRNGSAVSGISVAFSITAPTNGPSTIESGLTSVITDSNGVAITRITTGNTSSPTNVILKAAATVASQSISATTTFMVVPDITKPSMLLTTDRASYDVNSGPVTATTKIIKNGVAVFGVPVTYSVLTGPVTLGYRTPTTDRNGTSIATLTVDDSTRATTNTILQATAAVDGTTYIAYAQFTVNGFDPTAAPAPTVNITLTADRTQVDANNGTVMLNANLFYGSDYLYQGALIARGTSVPNQPVTFTVLSGPPGTTISGSTLQTDKNGNSKAILTTGNTPSTTNVIVEASTLFDDGKTYRAYTTIQIVRGGGVIMFTDFAGLNPLEQSNMLSGYAGTTDSSFTPSVTVVQLIPFKLTDSNGNPRVGIPVTLSTQNISPATTPPGVIVNYSTVSEAGQQTIITDNAGMGIFNISVVIASPPLGSFTARTVVFRAVTNDTNPVTAYVGRSYSLTSPTAP